MKALLIVDGYVHDYGTIVHAITATALAAAYTADRMPQGGITGFQAGAIGTGFLRHWLSIDGPFRLVAYRDTLFPQNAPRFARTLSPAVIEYLREEASKLLADGDSAAPEVLEHWQKIAAGELPFGYQEAEEEA